MPLFNNGCSSCNKCASASTSGTSCNCNPCQNQEKCTTFGQETSSNCPTKQCFQLKRVFDACLSQSTVSDALVTLTDFEPANPTYPLTFVSGKSSTAFSKLKNVKVTTINECTGKSRVQATVKIPLTITYVDANGICGTAETFINVKEDVCLCLPASSIIPYDITALAGGVVITGEYVESDQMQITVCVNVILKVTMDVEVSIPTYGYCTIPTCKPFEEARCDGFFNLPLYPDI